MEYKLIDFHTHILPGIDDGSKNSEMSVKMLKTLEEQGVSDVVLSSHFYASQNSIEEFVSRREKSLGRLLEELDKTPVNIRLHLGAEVLFMDYIDRVEGLGELAIGKTKYILLEMPFVKWSERMLGTVYKVIGNGYTPIIAHFERYIPIQGKLDHIYELKKMGCILQMNAGNFKGFFQKGKALKFFADNTASLLGTDCHNLDSRPPQLKEAYDVIGQKLGEDVLRRISSAGEMILENSRTVYR